MARVGICYMFCGDSCRGDKCGDTCLDICRDTFFVYTIVKFNDC